MKTQIEIRRMLVLATLFVAILIVPLQSQGNFASRIDSMNVLINNQDLRLPGESFPIEVLVYYKNGKVKSTANFLKNAVPWTRFKVEVVGGSFSLGRVYVDNRLMPSKGKYVQVKVYPRKATYLQQTHMVALNYETKLDVFPTQRVVKAPGFGHTI